MVLPVIEAVSTMKNMLISSRRLEGKAIPACSMRDNIIVAPLGRSVTFFALGAVVVNRNRLVTQATTGRGLDLIAASVLIGNLGLSNELTLGLLVMIIAVLRGRSTPGQYCKLAKEVGLTGSPGSLWPPLVRQWATGKTLICENQITLDVTDEPPGFGISSVLAFSLDDLGMTDNQCEIISTNMFFYVDALLAGGSARVADNRFSETWMHVLFSGLSIGGMNTTTDNQSTHCLLAKSLLNLLVFRDNLALVTAFCPDECGRARG